MSEMIERVAEALYRNACEQMPGTQPAAPWVELCEKLPNYVEGWRVAARAAIPAMREPTADMVLAALAVQPKSLKLGACIVSAKYAAMIDEALK